MELNIAVARLGALAQESRLAIFRMLVRSGPDGLCVSEIAAGLRVAPATLSFHLKELASAGLITSRQQGRFIHYAADFAAMGELLEYLTRHCCQGSGRRAPR